MVVDNFFILRESRQLDDGSIWIAWLSFRETMVWLISCVLDGTDRDRMDGDGGMAVG